MDPPAVVENPDAVVVAQSRCCQKKFCNKNGEDPVQNLELCAHVMCNKYVHRSCSLENLRSCKIDLSKLGDSITCTRGCFDKFIRTNSGTATFLWSNDAKGPGHPSSVEVLLSWWTTEGNWSRYCGGEGTGESKMSIANEVARLIQAAGCLGKRTGKDVQNKIKSMSDHYKKAVDWLTQSGNGCDDQTIHQKVTSICYYFYDLDPIMGSKNSSRPWTLNPDDSSDDEESDAGFDLASSLSGSPGNDVVVNITNQDDSEDDDDKENENENDISSTVSTTSKQPSTTSKQPSTTKPKGQFLKERALALRTSKKPKKGDEFSMESYSKVKEKQLLMAQVRHDDEMSIRRMEVSMNKELLELKMRIMSGDLRAKLLRERADIMKERAVLIEKYNYTKEEVEEQLPLPDLPESS